MHRLDLAFEWDWLTSDIQETLYYYQYAEHYFTGYRLLIKFGYINPNPADDAMRTDEEARVKQDKNNGSIEQRRVE